MPLSGASSIAVPNQWLPTAPKYCPDHPIRPSKAQRNGVKYDSASGCAIDNEGDISVVHRGPCGKDFGLVIQNAKVACPIVSIRYFTRMGCTVVFKKGGGIIHYPDGRKIPFIERLVVFLSALNILTPNPDIHAGMESVGTIFLTNEQKNKLDDVRIHGPSGFARQGDQR